MSYQLKATGDGSYTLNSPIYGEDCHSSFGAKTETMTYYLGGCEILEKLKKKSSLTILEVGFGIGVGLRCTYEATKDLALPVHYISLEIDRDLIAFVKKENLFSDFQWTEENNLIQLKKDHIRATILIGDARESIRSYSGKIQAIYQDAFSPKKNPMLWTVEWFRDLKSKAEEDCLMCTYSASSSIRKSMIEAGWIVKNGPKFEGKRMSTKAQLVGTHDEDIVQHLNRSPVPIIWDATAEEFAKMR